MGGWVGVSVGGLVGGLVGRLVSVTVCEVGWEVVGGVRGTCVQATVYV